MLTARVIGSVLWVSLMVLGAGTVSGQNYPNKPIRMVGSEVGGSTDTSMRIFTPALSAGLGQQVIIENRAGNIIIPAQIVAKAPPDGYTLFYNAGNVWLLPYLQDNVPYDPVKDFSTIGLTVRVPTVLVVHPSFPAKTVKELIALAKAKPGELSYASGVSGSSGHMAMELFKYMAGVNIVRISYNGTGPSLNAVIAGEVRLSFPSGGAASPHIKAGRLRAVAVANAEPSELWPGLPTVAASGLPGFTFQSRQGIWAPAKTPAPIIKRLNQEIVRALNNAEVKELFKNAGTEIVASSPEEFSAAIKSEMTGLGKVLKDAGVRGE